MTFQVATLNPIFPRFNRKSTLIGPGFPRVRPESRPRSTRVSPSSAANPTSFNPYFPEFIRFFLYLAN
jgi:hypothetical protein